MGVVSDENTQGHLRRDVVGQYPDAIPASGFCRKGANDFWRLFIQAQTPVTWRSSQSGLLRSTVWKNAPRDVTPEG